MQHRTIQPRRTDWRLMTGPVTWWHTKGKVSKIPLRCGTCVTVQPCLQPFLWSRVSLIWLSPPPAITIKRPSAVGTRVFLSLNWSLTAVSPLSDMPIAFHFWHLSVLHLRQVRRFFCSQKKCIGNRIFVPFQSFAPRALVPLVKTVYFKEQKNSSKGMHECVEPHKELDNWPYCWPIIQHWRWNSELAIQELNVFATFYIHCILFLFNAVQQWAKSSLGLQVEYHRLLGGLLTIFLIHIDKQLCYIWYILCILSIDRMPECIQKNNLDE